MSNRLVGPVGSLKDRRTKTKKASYESRNNFNYPPGAGADWCSANVGLQHIMGLRSWRDRRLAPGNCHHPRAVGAIMIAAESNVPAAPPTPEGRPRIGRGHSTLCGGAPTLL